MPDKGQLPDVMTFTRWTLRHVDNVPPCMCAHYNLVETHCYSIGQTGQLLSNHIAVEADRNVFHS